LVLIGEKKRREEKRRREKKRRRRKEETIRLALILSERDTPQFSLPRFIRLCYGDFASNSKRRLVVDQSRKIN